MHKFGILLLVTILWAFIDIVELRRDHQVQRREIPLGENFVWIIEKWLRNQNFNKQPGVYILTLKWDKSLQNTENHNVINLKIYWMNERFSPKITLDTRNVRQSIRTT